ncbi:hypothetical protein BgAZ_600010 (apicoplast) [Babesia gibsoni]|uniref:Ribosomal protein S2 n=1 Tax=Babesia gibsoni TaxID=33632 RepID=A0AAD8PC59_BABGI|nr:hypothetical protein BgAZ_600010 [Babesia gibsoni]
MSFLTFNSLLSNYLHISNIHKLYKYKRNLYKIINNSYIINLVYISTYLYKLYKLLFLLSIKNIYITFINTLKLYDYKFINYLLNFTNNNCFNRLWINGIMTNHNVLINSIIIYIFIKKLKLIFKINKFYKNYKSLYNKYRFIKYLKNIKFSKFLFFNLDLNISAIKESLITNKFIMGICDLNFNNSLIDMYVYSNNLNYKSINFILKFIITATTHGNYILKFKKSKK